MVSAGSLDVCGVIGLHPIFRMRVAVVAAGAGLLAGTAQEGGAMAGRGTFGLDLLGDGFAVQLSAHDHILPVTICKPAP